MFNQDFLSRLQILNWSELSAVRGGNVGTLRMSIVVPGQKKASIYIRTV